MVGWGYTKDNGPATWANIFPIAGGRRQSPININCRGCNEDSKLTRLRPSYQGILVSELSNSGFSWQAKVAAGESNLVGGPLGNNYVLEQFHCHWGKNNDTGSEHTIDGHMFPGELHLVHWNKDRYSSFAEAAASEGGLAVLGVFLTVGQENAELNKISKLLPFIQHKGQAITIPEPVNPSGLIPKNGSYFTYAGSLTTPPCYETVTWLVYQQPMQVSQAQLDAFRAMKSYHPSECCPQDELAGCLVENYRPPCPLFEREVKVFNDTPEEE